MSASRTIQLTEIKPKKVIDDKELWFTREDALAVLRQYGDYIDVSYIISEGRYELQSKGNVGHFPVADDLLIIVTPKVTISNLFEMLEYAFDLESFKILPGETHIETIEELFERFASILAQRVLLRVNKGLYCSYFSEADLLAIVRGRVCIARTVRQAARGETKLYCTYQEHSYDVEDNRILLWTLFCLRRLVFRPGKALQHVQLAYRALLGSVTLEHTDPSKCLSRSYNRLNEDYKPMHRLCALLLRLLGPGLREGDTHLLPFRVHMPSLFEVFVFRWLKEHLEEMRPDIEVKKKHPAHMEATFDLRYEMDIVLQKRKTDKIIAVLDTKYKLHKEPKRDDLHQVAIYAKLAHCSYAILVYPSHESRPERASLDDVTIKSLVFDISQPDLDSAGYAFLEDLFKIIKNPC
jgi:5-methylcytosine-specific restriction enzyme subunit McrC